MEATPGLRSVCISGASGEARVSWVLQNDRVMADRGRIEIDLIKLAGAERILRLTEPSSGLSLEKKLAPSEAVVRQEERLGRVFEAALARAEALPT